MANISELLKKIKSARYGRDVRDSIHDAIQAMNTDIKNNVPTVQSLTERAEGASSSAKTYSTDASAAATNAKNYSDSAKQYSESAASAIARAYDMETTANKHLANTVESPMLVTKATRNLLNPTMATTNNNGVTCTNNGDGTYTLNGTASANATFIFIGTEIASIWNEHKYDFKLVGCPSGSTGSSSYWVQIWSKPDKSFVDYGKGIVVKKSDYDGQEFGNIAILIANGKTVSNLVFKPMLTTDLDATYDDFVPYSGYDVKTCGKNFVDTDMQTKINNGVTCTNNGDGTYTLNGTATPSEAEFALVSNRSALYKRIVGKNVLFLNGGHKYNSNYRILFNVSNSNYTKWGSEKYDGASFVVPSGYELAVVDIHVNSGATVNNLVVKPMITLDLDATNDDFISYQDGETVHIDSSTEFPLLNLKSFGGETNIISPGNVEVSHALTDTGKYVMQNMKDISDIKAAIVASGSTTE